MFSENNYMVYECSHCTPEDNEHAESCPTLDPELRELINSKDEELITDEGRRKAILEKELEKQKSENNSQLLIVNGSLICSNCSRSTSSENSPPNCPSCSQKNFPQSPKPSSSPTVPPPAPKKNYSQRIIQLKRKVGGFVSCLNCGFDFFIDQASDKCPECKFSQDNSDPRTSKEFLTKNGYTECANCCCALEAKEEELPKKCQGCLENEELICPGCKQLIGHLFNCCFFRWEDQSHEFDERQKHCDRFHVRLINENCFCGFKGIQLLKDWEEGGGGKRRRMELCPESVNLLFRSENFLEKSERLLRNLGESVRDFKKYLEEEAEISESEDQ